MNTANLEALEARHAKAIADGRHDIATPLRYKARKLAAELNVPAPAWAAQRQEHARPDKTTKVRPTAVATPALELPAALRNWHQGGPGRVVNIKRDGSVRLLAFGDDGTHQQAGFADVRTAERALLLGITWRPLAKKAG